jgi:hypothetical protein
MKRAREEPAAHRAGRVSTTAVVVARYSDCWMQLPELSHIESA